MTDTRTTLVKDVVDLLNNGHSDPKEAINEVLTSADNEAIRGVARWGLYESYKEYLRVNSNHRGNGNPDNQSQSRFDSVEDKLNLPYPIDQSGEQKPFREWTLDDVRRRKEMLHNLHGKIATRIKHWETLENVMVDREAKTVEDVQDHDVITELM